jgi:hypothetical protein
MSFRTLVSQLRIAQLSNSTLRLIAPLLLPIFLGLQVLEPEKASAQTCLGYSASLISHETPKTIQFFGLSSTNSYPCRAGNYLGSERVFRFTVVQNSKVSARLEFPNPANTNADIFLLSSCSPLTCIASGDVQIAEQTLASGTYFLVVDSKTTTQFSARVILSMKDEEGYCLPGYTASCSPAYFIDSVFIKTPAVPTVTRLMSGCTGNALNYSSTTGNPSSVFRTGATVQLDVRMFRAGSHHSAAWLDFNNDKSFDAQTELLFDSNGRGKGLFQQTINHRFVVPELTSYGPRRLRIRNASEINGDVAVVAPCNELREGETEDYILMIEPAGCTPKYTQACSASAGRTQSFRFKTINNLNVPCNGNTFNYTNYPVSSFTASISPGVNYPTSMVFNYAASAAIWIDYNGDGDFFDSGELVTSINTASLTGNRDIKVPTTATPGTRKMRVRTLDVSRNWVLNDACALLTGNGLTQDYTITVVNQALSINSQVISACRGQNFIPGGTATGDFRSENRFIGQFSDASGSFANPATVTDIELGTVVNTAKPLPSGLTPGGNYKFRILSTNPALTTASKNVTVQSNLCNSPGITTGKIANVLTLDACKGQLLSVPFSTNDISTIEWSVQISGPEGAEPFSPIPGAVGFVSPISVMLPAKLATAKNYRIRVIGNIGGSNPIISSVSPTLIQVETCLKLASTPTQLCKGTATTLAVSSTGIANGTAYRAELSASNGGFLPSNNTVIGTSTVNNQIVVTVPCNTTPGDQYVIRLVGTAAGSQPGGTSGKISVPVSCFSSPVLPPLLCRGTQISSQLKGAGCFNADNTFLLDFFSTTDSSTVLFALPITSSGGFTVPLNATPGSYFVRHRSTSPVQTSKAVGPFTLFDCPTITLQSVCRLNGQLTAQFSTTNSGSFFPGNQFRVEVSSQAAGAQTLELGRTLRSPVVVAQEPTGFPQERRLRIVSTQPEISSNFIQIDGAPACATPTLTLQSVSVNPSVAGPPSLTPTATMCSGGKLRIDFTTSGIFGADQVVVPRLTVGNNLETALGSFPVQSPIVITIPAGFPPGSVGSLRLTSAFPVVSVSSTNLGLITIGACPTLSVGAIANTDFCANNTLSIPFTSTGTFLPGNVFSAEVLPFNGAVIGNPVALSGTGVSSPLQVSLPSGFSASGSFLVRVKSSNPELVSTFSPTVVHRLVPVLTGYLSDGVAVGGTSKVSGQLLQTATQAFLGTTPASFLSNATGTQIDLTIPNTTSGNWTVRNGSCISNPLAQTIFAAINFNLFDAGTDQNLGVLKGGTAIDLTNLSSFNIRGNFNTPGFDQPGAENPGSVKLELTGPVSQTVIDNHSPFTFFGDVVRADGTVDFLGSTLPPGNYSIKATPYELDDAQGRSGIVWTTAFSVAPPRAIATGAVSPKLCQGESAEVAFSTVGLFKPETVFSVELSSANGSFSNPRVLASGSVSPISVVVPVNQPQGNGYRIRVSSTNPSTPTLESNSNGPFRIKKSPQLSHLSKSLLEPGEQTTLYGSGFNNVTEVLFNGLEASNFTVTGNEEKIKVRLPVGATSGLVTVVSGGCSPPLGLPYVVGFGPGRLAVDEGREEDAGGFYLFPNPTTGPVTLRWPAGESGRIRVINPMGQQVLEVDLVEGETQTDLNLTSFSAGIYLVRMESVSGKREFRVVKQ